MLASHIAFSSLALFAQAMSSRGRDDIDPKGGQPYAAAAMSLVFHAANPMVPTLRADVRLFQVAGSSWFGGGCDLTPSYLFEEDAREFHTHWRDVCGRYNMGIYPDLKAWCDRCASECASAMGGADDGHGGLALGVVLHSAAPASVAAQPRP